MGAPPNTGMNFNCTATQPGKDNYDDYPVQFAEQDWSKVPVGGPKRQGGAGGSNPSTSTKRTFNLSNQGNVSGTYNTRPPTNPSGTCSTYFNNKVNVSELSSRQRKRLKAIFYMLIKNNIHLDEASKLCLMPWPEIFARVPTLELSKEFAHLKPKPEVLQEKASEIQVVNMGKLMAKADVVPALTPLKLTSEASLACNNSAIRLANATETSNAAIPRPPNSSTFNNTFPEQEKISETSNIGTPQPRNVGTSNICPPRSGHPSGPFNSSFTNLSSEATSLTRPKGLSKGAKRKFRWLIDHGISQEETSKLCLMSWPDILEKIPTLEPPEEKAHLKRKPDEELQAPAKKAPNASNEVASKQAPIASKDAQVAAQKPLSEGQENRNLRSEERIPLRVGIRNVKPMDTDQIKSVISHLRRAISKQFSAGIGPEFFNYTRKADWVLVTCVDQKSRDWLKQEIQYLEPWPGAILSIIPEHKLPKPKVVVPLPSSEAASTQEALFLLKIQNKGLNTEFWRVLHERVHMTQRVVTFSIDEGSLAVLRAKDYVAALGLQMVTFSIMAVGSQFISSDNQNIVPACVSQNIQTQSGRNPLALGAKGETAKKGRLLTPNAPRLQNKGGALPIVQESQIRSPFPQRNKEIGHVAPLHSAREHILQTAAVMGGVIDLTEDDEDAPPARITHNGQSSATNCGNASTEANRHAGQNSWKRESSAAGLTTRTTGCGFRAIPIIQNSITHGGQIFGQISNHVLSQPNCTIATPMYGHTNYGSNSQNSQSGIAMVTQDRSETATEPHQNSLAQPTNQVLSMDESRSIEAKSESMNISPSSSRDRDSPEEAGYNAWIIQNAESFVASFLIAQISSQPVEVVPPPTGYGDQMNESHWSSYTLESRLATENYRSSRSRSPESSNYNDRIGDDRKRHRSPYTQENRVKTKRFRDGPSRSDRSPKSDYRDQIDDRERYRSPSTQKSRAGTERYVGVAEPDPCQYCRKPGHRVPDCGNFLSQRVGARRNIAKQRMWCFGCLGNHLARDCVHPHPCKGCGGRHHHILCTGGAVTPHQMNESHWSLYIQESRLATENYRSSGSRSPESSNYNDRIGDDRKRHRSPYTQENRVKTKRFRDGPSRSDRSPKSDYRDQIDDRERYRSPSTQKSRAGTERYVGVAEPDPCQYCRKPGHRVPDCGNFLSQRVGARRNIAKQRMWCFGCLGNHLARDCAHPHPCKGCGGRHHHILCTGGAVTPHQMNESHWSLYIQESRLATENYRSSGSRSPESSNYNDRKRHRSPYTQENRVKTKRFREGHSRSDRSPKSDYRDQIDDRERYRSPSTQKIRAGTERYIGVAEPDPCQYCRNPGHRVPDCGKFLAQRVLGRRNIAKQRMWCFGCLGNHLARECAHSHPCKGCGGRHHHILCTGGAVTPHQMNESHWSSYNQESRLATENYRSSGSRSPESSNYNDQIGDDRKRHRSPYTQENRVKTKRFRDGPSRSDRSPKSDYRDEIDVRERYTSSSTQKIRAGTERYVGVPEPDPCQYCRNPGHRVAECGKFLSQRVGARRNIAKTRKWCFVCLGKHLVRDCANPHPCKECGGRHHHILCRGGAVTPAGPVEN